MIPSSPAYYLVAPNRKRAILAASILLCFFAFSTPPPVCSAFSPLATTPQHLSFRGIRGSSTILSSPVRLSSAIHMNPFLRSSGTNVPDALDPIRGQTRTGPDESNTLLKFSRSISNYATSTLLPTLFATTHINSASSYGLLVPLPHSLALNALLFFSLRNKLYKMLTFSGFAHAMALGTMLWATLGWRGWTVCVLYLLLGQAVTKVKFAEKEERGIAESRGGRRGPENVWGSAATGLICAACSIRAGDSGTFLGLSSNLFILGYISSLATKLADTFASEIGKAYGKTTFLITTLERVEPGTEGAISLEGTVAAAVGGLLLPCYGLGIGLLAGGLNSVMAATLAAFLATNAESLIGATLQGKKGFGWMTNEIVNFLNTVIGAGLAIFIGSRFMGLA